MKTKQKHTPGPWKINGQDIIGSELNGYICTWSGRLADAQLIAASPMLLETLKELNRWVGVRLGEDYDGNEIAKITHEAIAKAEGRED